MIKQLTEHIYYQPAAEESGAPSIGYIHGSRFNVMIDGGNTPKVTNHFLHGLKKNDLPVPDFTVLTHWHWDHTFGLSPLENPIIACDLTNQHLKRIRKTQWSQEALYDLADKGVIPRFCIPSILREFPRAEDIKIVLPNIIFHEDMQLNLGGLHCILKRVESSHCSDTVIAYIPEEKVVFLGDSVYQELQGVKWVEHPEKLRALTETLKRMDFQVGMPSHRDAMTKHELLTWFESRLQGKEVQI